MAYNLKKNILKNLSTFDTAVHCIVFPICSGNNTRDPDLFMIVFFWTTSYIVKIYATLSVEYLGTIMSSWK